MQGRLLRLAGIGVALTLLAAGCGGDNGDGPESGQQTGAAPETEQADYTGDGSLGTVEVPEGDAIQIRSLNAISSDVASLGIPNQRGVELAIDDYGPIRGFDVDMGTGLDDLCSAEGGQAAAQTIAADDQVIGIIGTSCSGAAVAASPLISAAGMVMISPSNTSPALTSDLAGTPGENYHPGYYRTSLNDLIQGAAVARFAFEDLGLATAAAIHDGDPYTQGLAQSFANAFEALGGEMTGFAGINKEDTDMVPVLTELAAGSPQALFFPIFQPAGDFVADQAGEVAGLEDTVLIAGAALLVDSFMELPQSEGLYITGPDLRYGANTNQSTGADAEAFLTAYQAAYGSPPEGAYWAHSYDAATLLLEAIEAASYVDGDGNLVIDRAGVRQHLNGVSGFAGITGTLTCDDFGDCSAARLTIIRHDDAGDIDAGKDNIVFEYAP